MTTIGRGAQYCNAGDSLMLYARALMLAITHKTHIDTVLGYRQRYLQVRPRV